MTRLRCRYTLHLGHWRIPAGCGKVKQDSGEWLDSTAMDGQKGALWVGGPCPSCSPRMLGARDDFLAAKADQVQWRAHEGTLKAVLPADPFIGFHKGDE